MGTGAQFWAFITDIGRLFEKGAYFRSKAFAGKRAAFAAAFGAEGLTLCASAQAFHRTGTKMFAFRTLPCHFCGIMVHDGTMPAHLP